MVFFKFLKILLNYVAGCHGVLGFQSLWKLGIGLDRWGIYGYGVDGFNRAFLFLLYCSDGRNAGYTRARF